MNEVTNIRPGSMPAHLQSRRLNLNAAAHANLVAGGFPVLSYKGKTWSVKHHGEWEILQGSAGTDHNGRPLPRQPLQYLDVIFVGNSSELSKTYYEKSYGSGDDDRPDCFSINSISPDPAAPRKQHTSCQLCEKNQWGSRITDSGKKAKACTDYRRVSVVPAEDPSSEVYGGPMLLRIPPMSINNFDKYATKVEQVAGADISQVVTRISFAPGLAYPSLVFEMVGWVEDEATYNTVLDHAASDIVKRMLHDAITSLPDDDNAGVPTGTGMANLGPRPAHLGQPRLNQVSQEALAQAVQKEHALQEAKIAANANTKIRTGLNKAPQEPAQEPAQAAVKPVPLAPAPTPAPTPAPAQAAAPATPGVIQGAPDDLEDAVDDLLAGD